jgi:hypothetical protein
MLRHGWNFTKVEISILSHKSIKIVLKFYKQVLYQALGHIYRINHHNKKKEMLIKNLCHQVNKK